MKKILISLFLIFALCPVDSFAEDIVFQRISVEDSFVTLGGASISAGEKIPSPPSDFPAFFSNSDLEQHLCDVLTNAGSLPDVIDGLEQLKINKTDFDDMYFDIALKHPELFLKTGYTSLKHNEKTGVVQSIRPKYVVSSWEEVLAGREILAAGVKEYTQATKGYATDLEKLLVIHDKMVADCDYDVNALDKNTENLVPDSTRHAIGVFRDKVAVCQGYSQALYMIAKELGIEMDFCYSESRNHMWNYVKLDDKWYHMDMTSDDPYEKDENGNNIVREDPRALHTYFMVSDDGLEESAHGSDYRNFGKRELNCNDTTYETDHLFNMEIPFTAFRGNDGLYRVTKELVLISDGVTIPAQFVSNSLYIGAAATALCPVQTEDTTDLYLVCYPTKDIEKATIINRFDKDNSFDLADNVKFVRDKFETTRIAKGMPSNRGISFTSFLWETDTLVPCAEKAVWSQN